MAAATTTAMLAGIYIVAVNTPVRQVEKIQNSTEAKAFMNFSENHTKMKVVIKKKQEEVQRIQREKEEQARLEAERLAKEEAERIAQEEAERIAREEAERIAAEEAWRKEQAAAGGGQQYAEDQTTAYADGGSGVLTRSGGVNYYNGSKETWYSQKVLPGGGLDIPGRYVAEDGTVRDQEGYIVVALPSGNKGEVVETSLGTGKCYDTNAGGDSVDIYTDW